MLKKNEKEGPVGNHASNGAVAATNINAPVTINNVTEKLCGRNAILSTVLSSSPEDWHYDDDIGVYTYNPNVSLQIRKERKDELETFQEPWVKNYSDPIAYKQLFYIYYSGNQIEKYFFALVDGCRISIPYPKSSNNLQITSEQYIIGAIINKPHPYNFDRDLKQAGITIAE